MAGIIYQSSKNFVFLFKNEYKVYEYDVHYSRKALSPLEVYKSEKNKSTYPFIAPKELCVWRT